MKGLKDELACFAPGNAFLGSLGYGPGDREKMLTLAEEGKLQRKRQELTQTTPDQPMDNEAVYYKVAGECPKGRVYSLRSLGRKKRRYVDPDASTSQHPQGVVGGGAGDGADLLYYVGDDFIVMETPKLVEYDVEACDVVSANNGCTYSKRISIFTANRGYVIYGVGHQHSGGTSTALYG
ncbi:hypothetical protein Scep_030266 [Stephania cephalantha]|uniref:Uncharacterized protein n=1 Tax=Stephania cephalantha TaxID=152367 RepID=A0AAP0E248_9MAGN